MLAPELGELLHTLSGCLDDAEELFFGENTELTVSTANATVFLSLIVFEVECFDETATAIVESNIFNSPGDLVHEHLQVDSDASILLPFVHSQTPVSDIDLLTHAPEDGEAGLVDELFFLYRVVKVLGRLRQPLVHEVFVEEGKLLLVVEGSVQVSPRLDRFRNVLRYRRNLDIWHNVCQR